jgi:hypothetical protein
MSTRDYHILIQTIEEYHSRLNTYTESKFLEKINPEVWSPAEVYAHIIFANRLTVQNMQKAVEGQATEDNGKLPWKVRLLLFTGRFPSGRKVPDVVAKRTPQFLTIADAREATESLRAELINIWKSHALWSPSQKLKHPVLGLLNNKQWITFMKIHSIHHIKQLDRIRNF